MLHRLFLGFATLLTLSATFVVPAQAAPVIVVSMSWSGDWVQYTVKGVGFEPGAFVLVELPMKGVVGWGYAAHASKGTPGGTLEIIVSVKCPRDKPLTFKPVEKSFDSKETVIMTPNAPLRVTVPSSKHTGKGDETSTKTPQSKPAGAGKPK